jgi:tetratricopeptide (TPR) repeat protein
LAAVAPGNDDAQLHFQAGSAAYEAGDFTTAIQEWKAAQLLRPAPLLDFNIGLAYERLGRQNAACKYYRRYLEQVPQAPERAEIEARLHCGEAQAATPPGGAPPAAIPPGAPGAPVASPAGPPVATPTAPQAAVPATPPGGGYAPGGVYARPPAGAYPGGRLPAVSTKSGSTAPRPVATTQTKARKNRWWIVFPVLAGAAATVGIVALVVGASGSSRPRPRYDDFDLTSLPSAPSQSGATLFRF